MQKHLLWAVTASQKQIKELERKMKDNETLVSKVKELEKRVEELREEKDRHIELKQKQNDLLQYRVDRILLLEHCSHWSSSTIGWSEREKEGKVQCFIHTQWEQSCRLASVLIIGSVLNSTRYQENSMTVYSNQ